MVGRLAAKGRLSKEERQMKAVGRRRWTLELRRLGCRRWTIELRGLGRRRKSIGLDKMVAAG